MNTSWFCHSWKWKFVGGKGQHLTLLLAQVAVDFHDFCQPPFVLYCTKYEGGER